MKVIALASLGHSGSTFISLMMGTHPQLIDLSEADVAFHKGPVEHTNVKLRSCFCGEKADNCTYWSRVMAKKADVPDLEMEEHMFPILLETFREVFGDKVTPVLSFKVLHTLELLAQVPEIELQVIHLTRDVRGFCVSQAIMRRHKQRGFLQSNELYLFLEWYKRNRDIEKTLDRLSLDPIKMGYESFCFNRTIRMQKLAEELSIEPFPDINTVKDSHSHALRGNRLRGMPHKWELHYDARWLKRTNWMAPWLMLPLVRKMNQRLVYDKDFDAFWLRDVPLESQLRAKGK